MNKQKPLKWGALLLGILLILFVTLSFLPTQAATAPPLIRLRRATFDPLAGEPDVPAGQRLTVRAEQPATYLLQFTGPVHQDWEAQVEAAGAHLYGYIPDFAFLARMTPAVAGQVRALPFVRWVGPYHPAYRLAKDLREAGVEGQQRAMESSQSITLTVQTLPDADLDSLAAQVESWGGEVQSQAANSIAGYLRLSLPADRLPDLAALDGVLWVEPYFAPRLYNDVGGGQIMRAGEVRSSLALYGSGQIVAVADTGLDTGDESTLSADFKPQFVKAYALGRPVTNDWSDNNAHGTHVAGSVLGNGKLSGSNPANHNYTGSFAGVAPEASLVFQSIEDAFGGLSGIPSDLVDLFTPSYNDGARIHTNSWGGPTGGTQQNPEYGGYTTDAQQADSMMWQYRDMLILYAAGNSGVDADANGVVDPDSIGSPGTAKNVVTVGASENLRPSITTTWGDAWPDDFPVNPIFGDQIADHSAGMAAFSSRGPTDDGRVKPDIAAPGTFIISARSHDPQAGTGWGVYDSNYLYMGGTSMATPLTAGAAALVREWLTEQQGVSNPSAALMKAVLLNGGADISPGQYGAGSAQEIPSQRPNNVTGWGRVDLVESLNPPAPRQIWFKDNTAGLNTGGTAVYTLTVGSSGTQSRSGRGTGLHHPRPQGTPEPRRSLTISPEDAQPFAGSGPIIIQGTQQLLQNAGFETGAWSPWQTDGSPYLTNIIKYSGSWSAHLGNYNNADDDIWQQVDIPADATDVTIDFWCRLRTDETWYYADYFCYGLWDQTGNTAYVQRCVDFGQTGDVDWTQETYSLSADELNSVKGQTVLMGFTVETDDSLTSRAWVDDTALNVTTPDATPTPTPSTPTPTPSTPTPTPTPSTPTPTPTGTPPPTGGPFRITLAWTDYPGEPSAAKALVNDLDLEVIAPDGTHYYGNQGLYSSGQCLRSNKWDACNNVEGVIIPNAPYSTYTVIVHGYNVAQGPQPFALVASGDNLQEGGGTPPNYDNFIYLPLVLK